MRNRKVEEWITAFKKVAAVRLEERNHLIASESLPVDIQVCSLDEDCITVTLGEVMHHVSWTQGDPTQAAEVLFQKMLPEPRSEATPESGASSKAEENSSDILGNETETEPCLSALDADPTRWEIS
jgi:hypothetical protein